MSEWQPIETAPKDGTEFLAYIPSDGESFAEYVVLHNGNAGRRNAREPFWTTFIDDKMGFEPTLWAPITAPPAA